MVDSVRVTEREGFSMASILARRGADARAIGEAIAVEVPTGAVATSSDAIMVMGSGPGTWLVCANGEDPNWCDDLAQRLAGLASVSDQTGAYRLFEVEDRGARALLQRGANIDLDDAVFPAGSVAATLIGHVDVVIRCLADGRSFEVAVYRSYADSFLRWVDSAVAGL